MGYYKIIFEGKFESVKQLFKDREWENEMKLIQPGIILVKISEDIQEEISFSLNVNIDDTNTIMNSFNKITQSEFEQAENKEIKEVKTEEIKETKVSPSTQVTTPCSDNILKDEKPINNMESKPSTMTNEISHKEEKSGIFPETPKPPENYNDEEKGEFCANSQFCFDFEKLSQKFMGEYKFSYDYFFSKNYLAYAFILSVFGLLIFRF